MAASVLRWTIVIALFLISLSEAVGEYTFTKILDTTSTRPGTVDPFTDFNEVYYDGANVAFIGRSVSGAEGVYRWNGTELTTVADTMTAAPGAGGRYVDFTHLSLDGGQVAFIAQGTSVDGVYTTLGGSLRKVADTTTIMPGSTVPFTSFDTSTDVEIAGNRIAFTAFGTNGFSIFNEGAYLENSGVLQVVADRSDVIPERSDAFIFFSEVDVDATGVVFDAGRGTGGGNGFYTTSGAPSGSYRVVYNTGRSLPGLTQPNVTFSPNSVRMDDGKVAFEARGANDFAAIFIDSDGAIETAVSTSIPDPVTGANFRDFYSYTFDNGEVAFVGFSTSATGIYRYANGSLEKVINSFEFLEGKDVSSLSLSPGGLHSSRIAFRAAFTDGTSAIYLATPEETGDVQTIALAPTFDVQLTPGTSFTITEGTTSLEIDGGFGASFPAKDVLLEFPLGQIPADAEIVGAKLSLDAGTSSGSVSIVVDGYAGDGLASTADVSAVTTELAVSPPYTASSDILIDLNADFVNALLGSASHLGLRLSSLNPNPYLSIVSSEATSGTPPRLTIDYRVPTGEIGDFDVDGDVDGADFLAWQRGDSPNSLSAGDLADWRANFGSGQPAASRSVPEPNFKSLMLIMAMAVIPRRGLVRGFSRPRRR